MVGTGDAVEGLSPPTRGSRQPADLAHARVRSIPAHTGKPAHAASRTRIPRVYPRPHGEAHTCWSRRRARRGLSPPTRGSRPRLIGRASRSGSIPAHTGKPRNPPLRRPELEVYPRPHGEAIASCSMRSACAGLSPPTRGSLRLILGIMALLGSIPAHTGKPWTAWAGRWRCGVYPRPHGEAGAAEPRTLLAYGLSPPTRGSL